MKDTKKNLASTVLMVHVVKGRQYSAYTITSRMASAHGTTVRDVTLIGMQAPKGCCEGAVIPAIYR